MNSHEEVVKRFFEIIAELAEMKKLDSEYAFMKKHEISTGNFYALKRDNSRYILKPEWMVSLVKNYNVSAHYLLTGEGPHFDFKKKVEKSPKHIGNERRINELETENQQLKEVVNEFKLILSNFDKSLSKKRKHALPLSPLKTD